jgi:hypothetical protein
LLVLRVVIAQDWWVFVRRYFQGDIKKLISDDLPALKPTVIPNP